jgi:hypothetical protein
LTAPGEEVVTVSTASAVYGVPLDAVAVMVQVPAVAGAVKSPELLIEPHDAVHLTATLAENCWVFPTEVEAEAGVIVMGVEIVTLVVAVPPVPSLAFPVTLHDGWESGALKRPEDEMLPHVVLQVDATLAVNCCVPPSLTVGLVGEIV